MWLADVELSANHPDRGNLIRRKPLGEHLDLQATFSVVVIAHRQGRLGQTHRSDGMGFLVQSGRDRKPPATPDDRPTAAPANGITLGLCGLLVMRWHEQCAATSRLCAHERPYDPDTSVFAPISGWLSSRYSVPTMFEIGLGRIMAVVAILLLACAIIACVLTRDRSAATRTPVNG
jgi:hypothetical protein